MLQKIISDGQTGAGYGALEAAVALGFETGGFAPKGYMTENGPNKKLKDYKLIEYLSTNYVNLFIKNINVSDGTLAFRIIEDNSIDKIIGYCQMKKWLPGKIKTMNVGRTKHKPICVITTTSNEDNIIVQIQQFIKKNNISCLNVVGHQQSNIKSINFERFVRDILIKALYSFI